VTGSAFHAKKWLISPDTFARCKDLVRQILVHLSLHARTLARTKDQVREASDMLLLEVLGTPFARPDVEYTEKTPGKKKHRPGQDSFRNRLISYYGCQNGNGDKIWCPVLGEWIPKEECMAAHIVPYSVPPRLMKIFLDPKGLGGMTEDTSEPSMVPQNGLYLYKPIERALDTGKLVIVPQLLDSGRVDFKVYLLDERLHKDETFEVNGEHRYWNTLDGKSLKFLNQNRPAKHLLYFQMLLIIIQKCIYQPPSWAYRLSYFIHAKEEVALSPHPHLIDGPLMRLSTMITDAAVFKQVEKIIPMAPIRLPDEFSEQDIEEVSKELNTFTAGACASQLLQIDPDVFGDSSAESAEEGV
jgi:hypothetical protein